MKQSTKKRSPFPKILCSIGLFLGFLAFFSARWFVSVYGRIGFDSILFTLSSSLGGVQSGLIGSYLLKGLLPCLLCTALAVVFLVIQPGKSRGKYQAGNRSKLKIPLLIPVLLALILLVFAAFDVELVEYILDQNITGDLYETYFVDPGSVEITFPEEKRNLIYIMLESMETTYLSEELGGAMPENLIPELYQLSQEHLTFSDLIGTGYYTTAGATWTVGSMVAQTAGIPLKTPTEDVNQYGAEGEPFLPGVTSLTNLLHDEGYYQVLMVGSDATFGGRRQYFTQHEIDQICDIYTARKEGIIPKDYFVWWGMEDLHLFEYAKQKLTEISAQDQPFAFTMLTVDTHHVGGYQCIHCQDSTSGETYDQSISCSSRQVAAFVEWIQTQEFYENTTVIIVGDHESMDNGYMERNVDEDYQRLLYNCFINSAADTTHTKGRRFCAEDLFPTTLAAIGCTIEGDRLGLGTNLFSDRKTLMETYGYSKFNNMLEQASDFYEANFYE